MNIHHISTYPTRLSLSSSPEQGRSDPVFHVLLRNALEDDAPSFDQPDTYTVRSGDSLFRIAQKLIKNLDLPCTVNQLVRDMATLNRLPDPDLILPGQVLFLPAIVWPHPSGISPQAAEFAHATEPSLLQKSPAQDSDMMVLQASGKMSPMSPAKEQENISPLSGIVFHPASPQLWEIGRLTLKQCIEEPSVDASPQPTADITRRLPLSLKEQVALYREDQLLANPGGDSYFLNHGRNVFDTTYDHGRFLNRVGKDLQDAGENFLNIAKNLALGSQFRYMAENGEIRSGRRLGLLGTLRNFVENVFSGLSFGAYMPTHEKAPEGPAAAFGHFFKKIFYDAPVKDLLIGIPHATANIVKSSALAALNLVEVIPDATIGHFDWGRKATTRVFDNGQVAVDYLTDILPGGNAWLRVHAMGYNRDIKLPVFYNLQTDEQGIPDSRWATVRNTPFRKTIETIGSLLSDAAIVALTTRSFSSSAERRHD